jgi:negative regulator of sigma E activity
VTPVTIAAIPEAITVGAVMAMHPAIPLVQPMAAQVAVAATVAAMAAAAVMAGVAEAINAAIAFSSEVDTGSLAENASKQKSSGDPTKAFCACAAALLDSF